MPKAVQGVATFTALDADKAALTIDTVACCHCGGHFPTPRFEAGVAARASRVGRGYCANCDGYVCGKSCANCVPTDLYLTNLEKGRPADFRPVSVYVPTISPEIE